MIDICSTTYITLAVLPATYSLRGTHGYLSLSITGV